MRFSILSIWSSRLLGVLRGGRGRCFLPWRALDAVQVELARVVERQSARIDPPPPDLGEARALKVAAVGRLAVGDPKQVAHNVCTVGQFVEDAHCGRKCVCAGSSMATIPSKGTRPVTHS